VQQREKRLRRKPTGELCPNAATSGHSGDSRILHSPQRWQKGPFPRRKQSSLQKNLSSKHPWNNGTVKLLENFPHRNAFPAFQPITDDTRSYVQPRNANNSPSYLHSFILLRRALQTFPGVPLES
jgi:hypothetical protein